MTYRRPTLSRSDACLSNTHAPTSRSFVFCFVPRVYACYFSSACAWQKRASRLRQPELRDHLGLRAERRCDSLHRGGAHSASARNGEPLPPGERCPPGVVPKPLYCSLEELNVPENDGAEKRCLCQRALFFLLVPRVNFVLLCSTAVL